MKQKYFVGDLFEIFPFDLEKWREGGYAVRRDGALVTFDYYYENPNGSISFYDSEDNKYAKDLNGRVFQYEDSDTDLIGILRKI